MRLFNLHAQEAIEMKFLKSLSILQANENLLMRMTGSNTYLMKRLNHIL